MNHWSIIFFSALAASIIFTLVVRRIALRLEVVDWPDGQRKLHTNGRPLLGGVAIFGAFWLIVLILAQTGSLPSPLLRHSLLGAFMGSIALLVVGIIDDWRSLSPWIRLAAGALAVLITLAAGVGLDKITNPFGGVINLGGWKLSLGPLGTIALLGDGLVFMWLMGMMYTTKVLDGLDGLATGIALVGTLMIFFLTMTKKFHQPEVGLLALALAGVLAGFLLFNFHPARIFLGEAGSLLVGFLLGLLAVISGGKIATTLLVMAVPILDFLRVIVRRAWLGRSVFQGDREHLHFRLLDAGFSERSTVLLLYALAFLFGITTLFLQSAFKLLTLGFLAVLMLLVGFWLARRPTRR